jgi:hypothetical protein
MTNENEWVKLRHKKQHQREITKTPRVYSISDVDFVYFSFSAIVGEFEIATAEETAEIKFFLGIALARLLCFFIERLCGVAIFAILSRVRKKKTLHLLSCAAAAAW